MKDNDNFYVATSIPYVNGSPHLGHALEFTYGDVLARYWRDAGKNVVFSIGTDEHGIKIADKAAELKLSPQELVDQVSAEFSRAAEKLAISNTHFIRTSSPAHREKIKLAWHQLRNYIYKDSYDGWYCRGCEAHRTETVAKANDGVCPDHGRPYERVKEENYFFKLSAFKDEIRQRIASDEIKVIPDGAKAEVLAMLDSGLGDFSISRPAASCKWGIEVPDDPEQIIYVWLDALLNYITVLDWPNGASFKSHWPADVQIIGRDILRFHAIYWPAFLLGLGLTPFRQLYVHGLITVEGQKISKSLGNTVDPFKLVEKYGLDAFRYFFMRHLPAYDNSDYSQKRFIDAYNNELVDQFGNLVQRLHALAWQKLYGQLPLKASPHFLADDFLEIYHQAIADCRFNYALNLLFTEIKELNRRLEASQPWAMEDKEEVAALLDGVFANLRTLNGLLRPFLPELSARVEAILSKNPLDPPGVPLLQKITPDSGA